ncbi:MAG: acyl-CoA thioesterase [Verrucomicrobia bacterium]|nr:MAG: acyl-CoA thioesterase [Verrucomicrobiota bacterium]
MQIAWWRMNFRWLNALLWGNSVALAWMWGLGLFFSVQMTFMFGLQGLLLFAAPNALGLMLFGAITHRVAKRHGGGPESLARFFDQFSKPFRLIFYLYQIVALALTVFALTKYMVVPLLEVSSGPLFWIYAVLVVFVILAAGCLFGEEFGIGKIKMSHALLGATLAASVALILAGLRPLWPASLTWASPVAGSWQGPSLLGFTVPLVVGLLVGPWLDLQHWQRAIQIHREKTSIRFSYLLGGLIFFLMLMFHGCLAYWVMVKTGVLPEMRPSADGFQYAHELITRYLSSPNMDQASWVPWAYFTFLVICVLTTLDSGYVALKWFLEKNLEKSENMILALVPKQVLGSPVPTFFIVGLVAFLAVVLQLHLEYFMVFYASFFVGYAGLAIARCYVPNAQQSLPQIRMLSMASLSLVVFAIGYLNSLTPLLILGSILPLAYVVWLVFNADLLRVVTERAGEVIVAAQEIPAIKAITKTVSVATGSEVVAPQDAHALGGHFEDKWFVYSSIASYADTNSVGNVYFGMYALYVGKARELFFNKAMPDFDLKTTKFYILTRSFEHKFVREAREFDTITVKIRVGDFNRKFCTLEHQIFGTENELLGKGKQSLLFVSSKDYALLDIPSEVYAAFMKYV